MEQSDNNNDANDNRMEPKKRRNRWGDPPPSTDTEKKPRKSRWDAEEPKSTGSMLNVVPGFAGMMNQSEQQLKAQKSAALKLDLQRVNTRLQTVVVDALRIEQDPNRSPSPPPRYDINGKRTNTRELRMREALQNEKNRILEELLKLNPQLPTPELLKGKVTRIIYLPKQNDPLHNYIGLIIGPRGNTQKQLEQETGTKISIRGKGSAKEASKGRAIGQNDDEELHVHVQGDSQANVDKACRMIEDILKPPDDDALNEHKQKQMRELALINGTLREDEFCPICGEQGHRQFECPHRTKSFKAAGVKCGICGDMSHPTRDCPFKKDDPNLNQNTLDNEYNSFMAELSGGAPSKPPDISNSEALKDNQSIPSVPSSDNTAAAPSIAQRSGGPTILEPIVCIVPKRTNGAAPPKPKTQTVIRVAQVMTGKDPPVLALSSLPIADNNTNAASSNDDPSIALPVVPPQQYQPPPPA